jgi:hypothetical protein
MAPVPWIVLFGAAAPLLVLAAVLLRRELPRGALGWVVAWAAMLSLQQGLGALLAAAGRNNHFLRYVSLPLSVAMTLWALSLWQTRRAAVSVLRTAIPVALAAWVVLMLVVEDPATFSTAIEPLTSLVGLSAAAYTLASRSLEDAQGLAQQDWFWTSVGLILYFGTLSTLGPLAVLLRGDVVLIVRAYELKSVVDVIAFLAVARGVTCPTQPKRSGSSSP